MHTLLALLLLTIGACDFDIPEKFEMPTWYLDLKIPLVQTRYQMSDISDSTSGIFLTDDSLGFKIIQEGEMPGTPLPEFAPIPIGMDQSISSGEIPIVASSVIKFFPFMFIGFMIFDKPPHLSNAFISTDG